jgi:hypothetical protein
MSVVCGPLSVVTNKVIFCLDIVGYGLTARFARVAEDAEE